jgi:hypothetical protein
MKLIQNNPYRIIGILVGATAAEQRRQATRLLRYIEADQEPENDYSFPSLGGLYRSIQNVEEATSKLNLDSDRINAALFWFFTGNPITDEPAFDAIKESDLDQVINIWSKLTSNGEVSKKSASAFSNLGTLYLSGIMQGTNTNEAILEQGLSLKLKFLESDFVNDLKTVATDTTFKTTKKELQLIFLNQVLNDVEINKSITSNKFLEIISKHNFSAKEDFLKGFVQKPIERIEKQIDQAKIKRKENKGNAVNIGKTLFEQSSENLSQLKSILGIDNLKYASIADKVSEEILQCGIAYFTHHKDSSTDPGSSSMDLFRKAKTLAVGNIAKQRCQENTENLQEWINDKPERDKQAKILIDLQRLKKLIDDYANQSKTIVNGKELLISARPYLSNIKNILGSADELYLGLSSRIASDVQGMCVSEINQLQNTFANAYDSVTKMRYLILLKEKVSEAWDITTAIGSMDLRPDFRTIYSQNKISLSNLKTQLAGINTGGKGSSGGSSGCYIATMAYGDYDHPQVLILRQFRDEHLDKSIIGRWFIKTYYHISPTLVEKLKTKQKTNTLIRKTLNLLIKLIK